MALNGLLAVLMILPGLLPALSPGMVEDANPQWPPREWGRGDIANLTDVQLLALLAGMHVDDLDHPAMAQQAEALADASPAHRQAARAALESLATALWHQERAVAKLGAAEREALAQWPAPGSASALRHVDHAEVAAAHRSLLAGSDAIRSMLEPQGAAGRLAAAIGVEAPPPEPFQGDGGTVVAGAVERLLAAASLSGDLEQRALATAAAGDGLAPALQRLAEEEILRAWLARQLPAASALPSPDDDAPDLSWGRTPATDGRAPGTMSLEEALMALASASGASADRESVRGFVQSVMANSPQATLPLAQFAEAAARYLARPDHASPGSADVEAALSRLETSSAPVGPDVQALVRQAQLDLAAAAAQHGLFTASQGLTGIEAVDGACTQPPLVLPPLVSLDACGAATIWTEASRSILVLDLGGNDTYLGRFAGAPFHASGPGAVELPVAFVVDLGGSDDYLANGEQCAQGAACADLFRSLDLPTYARRHPVGVLVDWDGDGANVTNNFEAGPRSQGYGGSEDTNLTQGRRAAADSTGTGILVERVGAGSHLLSDYAGGDFSQGSGLGLQVEDPCSPDCPEPADGVGMLLRMAGSGTAGIGEFRAGTASQGAASGLAARGSLSLGAFLNLVGREGSSHDTYEAGASSQGAAVPTHPNGLVPVAGLAMFADAAGEASTSNDVYVGGPASRGGGAPPGTRIEGQHVLGRYDAPGAATSRSALAAWFLDAADCRGQPVAGIEGAATFDAAAAAAQSHDAYDGPEDGMGWGVGAMFLDVCGDDSYAEAPPANGQAWWQPGPGGAVSVDAREAALPLWSGADIETLDDNDRDGAPAGVESLWESTLEAWDASDDNASESPLPVRPAVLIDTTPASQYLDGPYAIVVTGAGDDVFGSTFAAALHIDLGGDDTYLGPTATATAATRSIMADVDRRLAEEAERENLVGPTAARPEVTEIHSARPGLQPPAAPSTSMHATSIHLDLGGDDLYASNAGAQGVGSQGALGLLIDLGGNDTYRAATRAQGFGDQGGAGILVDVPRSRGERDQFHLESRPGQGMGDSGGLGLLLAGPGHATFADGVQTDAPQPRASPEGADLGWDGERLDAAPGFGTSANLGVNEAPAIKDLDDPPEAAYGPLEGGRVYTYQAEVADPDGDPVRVCWTFEGGTTPLCRVVDGAGIVQVHYAWSHVPSRPGMPVQPLSYTVEAVDPGGAADEAGPRILQVRNVEPAIKGELRGPRSATAGEAIAIQVPMARSSDLAKATLEVDWGEGTVTVTDARSIDWAAARWGSQASAADAFQDESLQVGHPNLDAAIDSDLATWSTMAVDPSQGHGPLQMSVRFEGPRHIAHVALLAGRPSGSSDPHLQLFGVRAGGELLPLQASHIRSSTASWSNHTLEFPEDLIGLEVVQVAPAPGANVPVILRVHALQALGPGASHAWPRGGMFLVNATVRDALGGSNSTLTSIEVVQPTELPVARLASVASMTGLPGTGRGPLARAAVATAQEYAFLIESLVDAPRDEACIEWGDGESTCFPMPNGTLSEPVALPAVRRDDGGPSARHTWVAPGTYPLMLAYRGAPGQEAQRTLLTIVEAEPGVDLRASTSGGEAPILFLAGAPDQATWHEGLAYLAVIDAGGNDRHVGRTATTRRLAEWDGAGAAGPIVRPGLLVDVAGNDDYVSVDPQSQAFAAAAGAAVLLDVAGNDVYQAPAFAQGAATSGGMAMLIDLGGDDWFNPLPIDGLESIQSTRAPSWTPKRPLPNSAFAVQGAGLDGSGALVLLGSGNDRLSAGSLAQGYGAHLRQRMEDYALARPSCGPSVGQAVEDVVVAAFCAIGVTNVRTDPLDYLQFQCGSAAARLPCPPDTTGAQGFYGAGLAFGPGLGMVVHGDGTLAFAASESAQASAVGTGRGLIVSLDGPVLAFAGARSQAFASDAQAGVLVGSPVTLSLGMQGQSETRHIDGGAETDLTRLQTVSSVTLPATTVGVPGFRYENWTLYPPTFPAPLPSPSPRSLPFDEDGTQIEQEGGNVTILGQPVASPPVNQTVEHPGRDQRFEVPGREQEIGGVIDVPQTSKVDPSLAIMLATKLDNDCAACSDDRGAAITLRMDLSPGLPGPGIAVTVPAELFDSVKTATVQLSSRSLSLPLMDVRVWIIPHAGQASGGSCLGPALAPPTLVWAGSGAFDPVGVPLNPSALQADGSPVLLAGCGQLVVQARDTGRAGTSEWTQATAAIDVASPLRGFRSRLPFLTANQDVPVDLLSPEPLGWMLKPDVQARLVHVGSTGAEHRVLLDGSGWNGASFTGNMPLPVSFPEGWATLEVRAPGLRTEGLEGSMWHPVADVMVDRSGFGFHDVHIPQAFGDRLTVDFRVHHASGAGEAFVRVLQGGTEVALVGQAPCPVGGGQCLRATAGVGGIHRVELVPSGAFPGGSIDVQGLASSAGADSGWVTLGTTLGDVAAPIIGSVTTPAGAPASNASDAFLLQVGLHDPLVRSCSVACPAGVGIAPGGVLAFALPASSSRVVPLRPMPSTSPDVLPAATFSWEQPEGIADGDYGVIVLAADAVGNLRALQPGAPFRIDRMAPTFVRPSTITFPAQLEGLMQTALKPGDLVSAEAEVDDDSGAAVVTLELDGTEIATLTPVPGSPGVHRGTGLIPPIAGPLAELRLRAIDAAGNARYDGARPAAIHPNPLSLTQLDTVARGGSISFTWRLDRDAQHELRLVGPDGVEARGTAMQTACGLGCVAFSADFNDLQPAQQYRFVLEAWDAAGWRVHREIVEPTLAIPAGTRVELEGLDGTTRSGSVQLRGLVVEPAAGVLSLRVDGADVAAMPIDAGPLDRSFLFVLDTTKWAPNGTGLRALSVEAVLHDGAFSWKDGLLLKADNTPPALHVELDAPGGISGWYNGSVLARASATDAANPVRVFAAIDGGPLQPREQALVSTDGSHAILFEARDAAVPPNVARVRHEFRVDRTAPSLEVGLQGPWATSNGTVSLAVAATDGTSGIAAFRVLQDGHIGPWQAEPPALATIGTSREGDHFVVVEAADKAGNRVARGVAVLVDVTPPEILAVQTLQRTNRTDLRIVSRDPIPLAGAPSGIASLRIVLGEGSYTDWAAATGDDIIPLPAGLRSGTGLGLQLRDLAGNVRSVEPANLTLSTVPLVPSPRQDFSPDEPLRFPSVVPRSGPASSPFAFAIAVLPLHGDLPDGVWVEIDGVRYPLVGDNADLDDGSRLYRGFANVRPDNLAAGHKHRFIAVYDGFEVTTQWQPGPLVLDDLRTVDDVPRRTPSSAAASIVAVAFAAFAAFRRRRP